MNRLPSAAARVAVAALLAALFAALLTACSGAEPQQSQPQAASPAADQQTEAQQQVQTTSAQPDQPQRPASSAEQQQASTAAPAQAQAAQSRADPPDQPATQQRQDQAQQPQQEQEAEPAQQGAATAPTGSGDVALAGEPILGGYQFQQPIEMLALPDGSFLVAEQRGYITRFIDSGAEIEQIGVLDLTESVNFGGEQGLLSIALDPYLEQAPYLYVYYSPRGASVTRLSRFRFIQGVALSASELIILEVSQPYANHNGGAVRFGPDGMLYLGLGDGGAANDPQGHGQNRETLLGAIIRIDVHDIDTATTYRVPPDNPFLGIAGVRPEIWAYGLRNPWRMAFDRATGDLWVGDVGQNQLEEVAIVAAGENHGWNVFEGSACFRSAEACEALPEAVAPIAEYTHADGCSVTGGEVYRGRAMPQLAGRYVFGDYCSSRIWSVTAAGDVVEHLQIRERIASFARDADGELYVLTFNGPIRKLVPAAR